MRNLFCLLISVLLILVSCNSIKISDCKIEKILDNRIEVNSYLYYMRIKFNGCSKKEDRINLVREEFLLKYSILVSNDNIIITEFLDKKLNVYRYEIKLIN